MFLIRVTAIGCVACGSSPSPLSGTDAARPATDAREIDAGSGSCVAPSPSQDCAAPLAPGDSRTCTLTVAGTERTYLVYAPATYDPCKPAALMVDAHGSNETAQMQAGTATFLGFPANYGSGMRLVADREGFLVVEPQGIGDAWSESDVAFMGQIPAQIPATLDPTRVFLSGISNGAGLTYWGACALAMYTGFAPVSGYDDSPCASPTTASLVHFHTTTDALVSYSDGQAAFAKWTAARHCTADSSTTFGTGSTDTRAWCVSAAEPWALQPCGDAPATTCDRYTCDGGTRAMFCTVPEETQYDGGVFGGHVLYFNKTHLSLAAVTWQFLTQGF
ncbi:MAG: hypothetical protein QM831_45350 [Kofleriaceae bacterium]